MRTLHLVVWSACAVAATTATSVAATECTCRAMNRDFELGRSVCLRTPDGARLATCGMVLNNTSWKISSTPCVVSTNRPLLPAYGAAASAHRHGPFAVADR
jgi:hypothetical protein